jgi:hypothetical protein
LFAHCIKVQLLFGQIPFDESQFARVLLQYSYSVDMLMEG